MKSEQQIRQELERINREADTAINSTKRALLHWILNPMPPEHAVRFACPKCGAGIVKIEPASGYYKYQVDKYTGEIIYNGDFESQNIADSWFECSSCRTIMNAEWRIQREKANGDEEDSDGPS